VRSSATRPHAAARRRSHGRFRYEPDWWGDSACAEDLRVGYWAGSRDPRLALALVVPLVLVYELGVVALGGADPDALRAGIDAWLRHGLTHAGLADRWLPPFLLVGGLLAWNAATRERPRRPRFEYLGGMVLESVALAVGLIGLSRLVGTGLDALDAHGPLLQVAAGASTASPGPPAAGRLLAFLGAGLYEEAVFRLALIPALYGLSRALLAPPLAAGTLAVTGSSLLFSLAHHLGVPGEAFSWYAFVFRWMAGVYFAWVFAARGFGIAVGCHVAYDWLVAWLDPHL
jgi:hypothetical protein